MKLAHQHRRLTRLGMADEYAKKIKVFLPILGLFVASCAHRWSSELPATHPEAKRIYRGLHDVVLPHVDLVDVSVFEAIFILTESARSSDPHNRGISIVVASPPSDGNSTESLSPAPQPKVTVRGVSMRYLDVLDAICRQAGLVWQIDPKCIVVCNRPSQLDED
jgi:hypothetical protein